MQAKRDFPDSAMGGFTRLLDTDEPDGLMEEIPTFLCGPWPEDVRKVRGEAGWLGCGAAGCEGGGAEAVPGSRMWGGASVECGPTGQPALQDYGPGRRAHTLRVWLTSSAPRGGRWIPEQYVLLIEPDILIFTPPPLLATPTVVREERRASACSVQAPGGLSCHRRWTTAVASCAQRPLPLLPSP